MALSTTASVREVDTRASQFFCELSLKNEGQAAVLVVDISTQTSSGVKIQGFDDVTLTEYRKEEDKLCQELSTLFTNHLHTTKEELAQAYVNRYQSLMDRAFAPRNFLTMSRLLIRRVDFHTIRAKNYRDLEIEISSLDEAKSAFARFFPDTITSPLKEIVAHKIDHLERLSHFQAASPKDYLARIEPSKEFKRVYVLRCKRGWLAQRSYVILADILFLEGADSNTSIQSESASITVTPNPLSVTVFGAIFAFLGALVALITKTDPTSIEKLIGNVQANATNFVVSVITAVIFINVFEFTAIAGKVRAGISWRVAILLGALCGLFAERMLAALKAFID